METIENRDIFKLSSKLSYSLSKLFFEKVGLRNTLQLICRRNGCTYYSKVQKSSIMWRCGNNSARGCKAKFTTSAEMNTILTDFTEIHDESCISDGLLTLKALGLEPVSTSLIPR